MKYTTLILLATQLASYVHGKPISAKGVEPSGEEPTVELRDLEFHELQAFFKRAAETAAASIAATPTAAAIPADENPFKTEELSTGLPDNTLLGRDDAPKAPGIAADENPFKTEEMTTDLPDNTLLGRDDAPKAPGIAADDNPFVTEEMTTDLPDNTLLGRAVEWFRNPRGLVKKATGSTVDLPQVQNPNHQAADGQTAYAKSYGKYSKNLPPALQEAAKSNIKLKEKLVKQTKQVGSVSATAPENYESEFVIPVKIGTPPQTIYMALDTGSADLWVFSTDTNKKAAQGHTIYSPKDSSTSKLLANQNWKIGYADGSGASGIVYTDKVAIGDTFVNSQAVESAQRVSSDFADDTFNSGILGMSFGGANTVRPDKQKTYGENIQKNLASPLFTANLQKGKPGTYQFGYIDNSAYTGKLAYTPVTSGSVFWQFTASGYQVGSSAYTKLDIPAIVDTGTTLLLLPSSIVKAYYSGIRGAYFDPYEGMYTFPCTAPLPDFYFGIGGYRGKVPGSYINYGNSDWRRCYGGIQSSDGLGVAIFGDILLKAQYVVFDMANKQIGFANKKTS